MLPVLTWAGLCFSNTVLRHASFIIPPSVRRFPCVGIVLPTKLRHDKLLKLEIPSCHREAPSEDELSNMVVGRRPWEAKAVWCCYCLKGITHAGQTRTHTHTALSGRWAFVLSQNLMLLWVNALQCMLFCWLEQICLNVLTDGKWDPEYLWGRLSV